MALSDINCQITLFEGPFRKCQSKHIRNYNLFEVPPAKLRPQVKSTNEISKFLFVAAEKNCDNAKTSRIVLSVEDTRALFVLFASTVSSPIYF